MARRGLTLLELLIALAIIIAMLAVATPAVLRLLDERRFESAVDELVQHLLLARAHAQTAATPVLVRVHATDGRLAQDDAPRRVVATVFGRSESGADDPAWTGDAGAAASFGAGTGGEPADDSTLASLSFNEEDETAAGAIAEPWANRPLTEGVHVTSRLPASDDVRPGAAVTPFDAAPVVPGGESGEPLRLAIFLPDGSAIVDDPVYLVDGNGRRARITINEWTGIPAAERLPDIIDGLPDDALREDEGETAAQDQDAGDDAAMDEARGERDRSQPARESASDAPASEQPADGAGATDADANGDGDGDGDGEEDGP